MAPRRATDWACWWSRRQRHLRCGVTSVRQPHRCWQKCGQQCEGHPMRALLRLILLMVLAGLALQLYFVGRIALMAVVAPESTAFQRSEVYRVASTTGALKWRQQWVPYDALSDHLK